MLRGETITHAAGSFAAGIGKARVRNISSDEVKGDIILDVVGEEIYRELENPILVEENDILEAYVDVA